MNEQERILVADLQQTCAELRHLVDEQAKAIIKFTTMIDIIKKERIDRETIFDDEVYSQYIKFDGGLILFK